MEPEKSGKTPDKEVKISHCIAYGSGHTETEPTGVLSPNNSQMSGPTKYSKTPLIRTLVIRIGLAFQVYFSRILPKITCLEITGYGIKYSTVLRLLDLHIRRGRNV
jgi:hypothetical protein